MRNTLRVQRAAHGEHGVSQEVVAKAISMGRDRLHRIERGYPPEPTAEERAKLAAYFGVREAVLFPRAPKAFKRKTSGAVA
jgi:transcriptional regulator with XRE-family HTH domain